MYRVTGSCVSVYSSSCEARVQKKVRVVESTKDG